MNKADIISLYEKMQLIRRMEEVCAELYTLEKIRGFLHLYIGEEAVATGVISQLAPEDNVVATYREHAHAYLKGIPLREIMAEMYGKVEGCSRGRGGSMHLFSNKARFFGGNAIVGAGIPQAVGLAHASQVLGEKRKTVVFFGEGAVAEGIFHEALNLASLWSIPLLFVCENNFYAMGTALHRSQAQVDITKKSELHLITSSSGDGMNIFDVVEKTQRAFSYIEKTGKPYFLEFKTYRFKAHSMFDPELYRNKNEVMVWKKKDPLLFLKNHLTEKYFMTPLEFKEIEREVEMKIQDAINFSENGHWESLEEFLSREGERST